MDSTLLEDGDKIVVPSFAVDVVNQRIIFADAPNKGLVFIQLAINLIKGHK